MPELKRLVSKPARRALQALLPAVLLLVPSTFALGKKPVKPPDVLPGHTPDSARREADQLLAAVRDESEDAEVRRWAAQGLFIARDPRLPQLVPILRKLDAIDVLAGLRDPWVVPKLAQLLGAVGDREIHDRSVVGYTTHLGPEGTPLVPRLLEILREPFDSKTRAEAAMALGSIGSAEAAGLLEEALGSWSWRVALSSARALGQLRPARSVGPLQRVRQNHYYPAVRNLAEAALASIAAGRAVSALGTREETLDLLWPAPPGRFVCEDLDIPAAPATETRVVSDSTPRRELPPPLRNLKGLRVFAPHGRGWLAGTTMGEFGGGLYVVEPGRRPRLIGDDPISYIARTDGEIRVVSNRGQSSFPDGAVWRLRQAASGTLEAEPLVELPSESFAVREGAGGALAIETYLGRIVVEPTGAVRTGPCRSLAPDQQEIVQTVLDAPALLAELDRVGMPRNPVIWAPRGLFSTITLRFRGAPARVWQDPYSKMPDGAHLELYALDLPFRGRPATLQIQCEGMQAAAEIVRTGAGRWEIKALRFDRRPPK